MCRIVKNEHGRNLKLWWYPEAVRISLLTVCAYTCFFVYLACWGGLEGGDYTQYTQTSSCMVTLGSIKCVFICNTPLDLFVLGPWTPGVAGRRKSSRWGRKDQTLSGESSGSLGSCPQRSKLNKVGNFLSKTITVRVKKISQGKDCFQAAGGMEDCFQLVWLENGQRLQLTGWSEGAFSFSLHFTHTYCKCGQKTGWPPQTVIRKITK